MNNIEKEIHIEGVGKIHVNRSNRARRLNITVKPFKGVRVSVPATMSYSSAARIVFQKSEWIKNALRKVREVEEEYSEYNKLTEYSTRKHKLVFTSSINGDITVSIRSGKIEVMHPKAFSIESKEVQFMVRKGIVEALRIEAGEELPKRVQSLALKHGFEYNKLALKNIRSRWGSCSRVNNINLSIHLMTLPDHLIDYVILHELVHTRIKNHGSKFWKELDKFSPGSKVLDRELRNYRISIF